ncbi:uncharacterized protein [Diabrotica undecimpunctata]|uniref:uncharacterized protein n=1 Tax=Diabrotica undecimpunctata TaxID=50387 RepID=UPI003B6370BF
MIEGKDIIIYTDHTLITFASTEKLDKCSPRQFQYLDFIGQFCTNIQHISGLTNIVADALSRVDRIKNDIDIMDLALVQEPDPELKTYLREKTSLQLKKIRFPEQNVSLYCDVATSTARPFVPKPLRMAIFSTMHNLAHPGINSSVKMIIQRYVWPSIKSDVRKWTRACL